MSAAGPQKASLSSAREENRPLRRRSCVGASCRTAAATSARTRMCALARSLCRTDSMCCLRWCSIACRGAFEQNDRMPTHRGVDANDCLSERHVTWQRRLPSMGSHKLHSDASFGCMMQCNLTRAKAPCFGTELPATASPIERPQINCLRPVGAHPSRICIIPHRTMQQTGIMNAP